MTKILSACLRSLVLLSASALTLLGTALPAAAQQAYYIHADHLNTPRLIEDQSQQLVWRWDNDDPFGGNMANANPSGLGTFEFNLRFPGQYFDKETSLHYNYFRDYSAEISRYVQSDPIGLAGGLNTYSYAYSAPLRYGDPFGLANTPAPTDPNGNLSPPPVPLPPGKNGQPNQWMPVPGSGTGDRDTKWKPKFPVPSPGGGQPGASWDPNGHWDVDNGQGGRDRYDPNGNPVDHDGNPICGDDCKNKVATVVIGTAGAYIVWRCARMIPSLFPPLWPTIPINAAIP